MNMHQFLPQVTEYLRATPLENVPGWMPGTPFTVDPLAQGEYNMNYLVRQGRSTWVFRVNIGSQIPTGYIDVSLTVRSVESIVHRLERSLAVDQRLNLIARCRTWNIWMLLGDQPAIQI